MQDAKLQNAKLIVFTAPSGAGKTTIVKSLLKIDSRLAFSISACTRERRYNEIHGQDYFFLSVEEFKAKVANNEFLEWEEVYPGIFYGTLLSEIERLTKLNKAILFDIDVNGALRIKKKFKENALTIFIKPPGFDVLVDRLRKRNTESEDVLKRRIKRMEYEMSYESKFDTVIINDQLEQSIHQAKKLVDNFLGN